MNRFQLPSLNYDLGALAPEISEETLQYHYGKHHKAYIENLNLLLAGSGLEMATLHEIVIKSRDKLYDNAAQAWNHTFYWNCLTPVQKKKELGAQLRDKINTKFGSLLAMQEIFQRTSVEHFGSGWTWLVLDSEGQLEILSLPNAGNPLKENKIPLLTCDLWEHAYYIDHRNKKAAYLEAFWKHINWSYVNTNYISHNYDHIEEQMSHRSPRQPAKKRSGQESSLYH